MLRTVLASDSFAILLLFRLRQAARRFSVVGLNHLLRRLQTVIYGIEIANEVHLGRGVCFVHPIGIVIGGNSRIGDRVRFFGSNTVGSTRGHDYPLIEDDVEVGCGARILGAVRVGARSIIGANAVVLEDVPGESLVAGIPARVVSRRPIADRT